MALALVAATEHDPILARALAIHLRTCEAAEAALEPARPERLSKPSCLTAFCGSAPEHPVVQGSSLVLFLSSDVTPAAATEAFEALLANARPAIGPGRPARLSARDNQAALQNRLVNPVAVAQALEDPLADFLRVLGPKQKHGL
jgi:hypothetical protein